MTEPPTWVSRATAARILGCAERSVDAMITRGDLRVDRPGHRNLPSLLRTDVEDLAERRAAQQRVIRQARLQRRGAQKRSARRRADPDGDEWISTDEAAQILGFTGVWVRVLAGQGRLPAIKRGDGAYRFRRRQITVISNAWRFGAARRRSVR